MGGTYTGSKELPMVCISPALLAWAPGVRPGLSWPLEARAGAHSSISGGLAPPSLCSPRLLLPACPSPRDPVKPLAHSCSDQGLHSPHCPLRLGPSLSSSLARCLPPLSTSRTDYQTPVGKLRADVYPVGQHQRPSGLISFHPEQNQPRNDRTLTLLWASPLFQAIS